MELYRPSSLFKYLALTAISTASLFAYAADIVDLKDQSASSLNSFSIVQKSNLAIKTGDSLEILEQNKIKDGNTHTRYQQYFNGIPVFGYHVLKHETANKKATLSGKLIKNIQKDLPQMSATTAQPEKMLQKIKQEFLGLDKKSGDNWEIDNEQSQMVIYIDDDSRAHHAYLTSFFAYNHSTGQATRPYSLTDIQTNQVLKKWDGLTTYYSVTDKGTGPGGNPKTGFYNYGDTNSLGLENYLSLVYNEEDLTDCAPDNYSVTIYDINGNYVKEKCEIVDGTDSWSPIINLQGDAANGAASPNNDALFAVTDNSEFYLFWNIKPTKNDVVSVVTHAPYFENQGAYWTGSKIVLSDGNDSFYPFTTMEIMGHEFQHAVTERHSGLIYSGESGAINESFSDIGGKMFTFYMHLYNDSHLDMSTFGESVTKDQNSVLRYMDDPTKDGHSIANVNDFVEGMDPHYASGIFNKTFYSMLNYTTFDNDYKLNREALFLIFIRANVYYWYPNITFTEAAWGLVQAAKEMDQDWWFQYSGDDGKPFLVFEAATLSALKEVGIYCNDQSCWK